MYLRLLFRAWQTLWKPVPELISILGVEVPDPPEVTLSGITSDSVTLHWSKPDSQKPASKYLIQVNGLNGIGETSWLETAITVTGLRPVHYYNIRVISVGSNNFQAGSLVIRVRTYGKNGRPALHSSYSPPNSAHEEIFTSSGDETSDDGHGVCVEATTLPEGLTNTQRDFNSLASVTQNSGQRKSIGGKMIERKQSTSTESTDLVPPSMQKTWGSKESVHQLTMQLESMNRDREKIAKEMTKEIEDLKEQFADICSDRDKKRLILKEKEEASEKLKKEVNHAERLNRQAQMRKSQKEKLLKEKLAERLKMKEDMKRWKREIEEMKSERGRWRVEKEKAEKKNQVNLAELKQEIKKCQTSLNIIEEEIRLKGSQIKKLEKNRKRLSACKNEELRLRDELEDRDWDIIEKALSAKLNTKSQQLRELASCLHQQQAYLAALQNRSSTIYQGYYSSFDYDTNEAQVVIKPRSKLNKSCQSISPIPRHSMPCSTFITPGTFSSQSPVFAPGPYIDMRNESLNEPESELIDHTTDEDYHSLNAGAPLSPTASLLLPSNIFADDDPPTNLSELVNSSIPAPTVLLRNHESQTTCSTSNSPSLSTSPLISSQQLSTYGVPARENVENDLSFASPRLSRSVIGSAKHPRHQNSKGFRNLFLPKLKPKDTGQDGPTSGSTSLNNSNTCPQLLDEEVTTSENKHRRISFASGWTGFLHKTSITKELSTRNDPPLIQKRKSNSQKPNFGLTGSSVDDSELQDAHSSSPHTRSVVSFDLPRPSTDSAPFGWGPAQDNITNRNSPLSTDWSHYSLNHNSTKNQASWPGIFPKRTSSKHGFNTAFLSRLASEDDDFLPPSEVMTSQFSQPSAIGTIGTRLLSSNHKSNTPKLNPEAPAFQKFNINDYQQLKMQKYRNDETDELHSSAIQNTLTSHQAKSKNQPLSAHTRKSVSENYEILDHETSGTPLELISSLNGKEKEESSLQRLLRKGSSSKFSISSFRSKEASLFSGKKSSTTYSDRNPSFEQEDSIQRASGDSKSKSLDSITSSYSSGKNNVIELTQSKDHAFKDGRINVSWGRFGFKGKKGRESLEIIDNVDDEN
ncbi:hypothetical protein EPUL_000992, partial [Erysiphe pulchra]